jgi:hypothetical protein
MVNYVGCLVAPWYVTQIAAFLYLYELADGKKLVKLRLYSLFKLNLVN